MLYREMGKTGDKVSILGYGCMRFPKKNGKIDEARTEKQVISAIEQGVNYFDTAYMYLGSEAMLGKILAKGYRDKVLIASKLPLPLVRSQKNMESLLDTQLQRLQTDHIDYYLMHSLMSMDGWRKMKRLGVLDFIAQAQKAGKIRRIGFSYHGDKDQFKEIVDDYTWDFCQIQYNYLDEYHQAGKTGLEYAASRGLGVVVMEPLRGGVLVGKMPAQIQAIWDKAEEKKSPAEWALQWVWNHPEVTVVLSGMNEERHIEENIQAAVTAHPRALPAQAVKLMEEVKEALAGLMKVGCTGCAYCLPCPAGINIPTCFRNFNDKHLFDDKRYQFNYLWLTMGVDNGKGAYASLCLDCGKCEEKCPQELPIRRHLKEVKQDMEGMLFKTVTGLVRGYTKIRQFLKRERKNQAAG